MSILPSEVFELRERFFKLQEEMLSLFQAKQNIDQNIEKLAGMIEKLGCPHLRVAFESNLVCTDCDRILDGPTNVAAPVENITKTFLTSPDGYRFSG